MWLILAAVSAGDARPVALPDWMAGCWEHRSQDRWTEECWTVPRGGIMLGNGRSGTGGVLDSWEVMHIELVETDDPVLRSAEGAEPHRLQLGSEQQGAGHHLRKRRARLSPAHPLLARRQGSDGRGIARRGLQGSALALRTQGRLRARALREDR